MTVLLDRPGRPGWMRGARVNPATDVGWRKYPTNSCEFLGAATNYYKNPRFITDTNSDGLPDEIQATHTTASAPTYTRDSSGFHIDYVGVAADVGATIIPVFWGTHGDFAPGDPMTGSLVLSGSIVGAIIAFRVLSMNAGAGVVDATSTASITLTSTPTPYSLSIASCGALTSISRLDLLIENVHENDEVHVTVDYVSAVKAATATSYFDGSSSGCAWGVGGANASASTRTASDLDFTDYVQITSAGVVAAGTKVVYIQNPSGTYYGPCVVTDNAKSGDWQTAFAATTNPNTIWQSLVATDLFVPLAHNSTAWLKR